MHRLFLGFNDISEEKFADSFIRKRYMYDKKT